MKPRSYTSSSDYLRLYTVFLLIVMAFALLCDACAGRGYRDATQQVTGFQLRDFYALEENSIELLIMGPSHSLCAYNPYSVERDLGLRAFNLSTALQHPDTAYFLLKEALKTQKPRYLIYDMYFRVFQDDITDEQSFTVLRELRHSGLSQEMFFLNLSWGGKARYLSANLNPFARAASYIGMPEPQTNRSYIGRGYFVSPSTLTSELLEWKNHPYPGRFTPYSARQIVYFEKLCELCRENDIKLICTGAPIPPTVLSRIFYYDSVFNASDELCRSQGVPYIDFNRCDFKVFDVDFADLGHMNRRGARRFNRYFTEVIGREINEAVSNQG